MPNVSADQHIKMGLKFLAKANKHVIRASLPLERLMGNPHPPGIHQLLKDFDFNVAGHPYTGLLTNEQATYLSGQTGSLKSFARAVRILLMRSSSNVVKALEDLNAAVVAPLTRAEGSPAPHVINPPAVGCCVVDGDPYSCTQTYCDHGLQGTWFNQPCNTMPLSKSSKAARAK
jgi:hypothetical protein